MPEAATIEPVVKEAPEYVPPQVPETPKPKVNRGDIFRKSLDTALKAERGEAPPVEPPAEKPSEPVKEEV
jgi:hypothetical protein